MTNDFRFKRFTVRQSDSAMKVGTDGVLLGAWCTVEPRLTRALDIGTGTGLIALMVAQRSEPWEMEVDAVDIDPAAAGEALHNFSQSPWGHRLSAHNESIQHYAASCTRKYDLIVSNPPYFERSLLPEEASRAVARHTETLTFDELISSAASMLTESGLLSVILPLSAASGFIRKAADSGLFLLRQTLVQANPETPPERSLMEFAAGGRGRPLPSRLVIEDGGRHQYSAEYMALTRDFYLKF